MKKAFIFYGGWEGHEPEQESARFQRWLEEENYQVTRVDPGTPGGRGVHENL